jgi:uncharacterized repeat protein (TIGR01451 family)
MKAGIKNLFPWAMQAAALGLILFCCVVSAQTNGLQYQIPAAEYNALVDLYNSAGGNAWSNNSGWLNGQSPTWYGVGVGGVQYDINGNVSIQGHVQALDLSRNQLSGNIPGSLGNLSQLQQLDLQLNNLTGAIPTNFGNLVNLQSLLLGFNSLSGEIPPSLGNLNNLAYLDLQSAGLTGDVPMLNGPLTLGAYFNGNCLQTSPGSLSRSNIVFMMSLGKYLVFRPQSSDCLSVLTGHIYCACDGSPIAGASVQIGSYSATSDSGGGYTISNLASETYSVTVGQSNYVAFTNALMIAWSGSVVTNDFELYPFPNILTQPKNQSVSGGSTATFTVVTACPANDFYQWQFDGHSLAGATNAALALSNLQADQAGSYAVVVTNAAGSTISSDAVLTVNVPPVITQQPAGVTANPGAAVAFSVTATGTTAFSYQWRFDGTSIPNATNATLIIASVQASIAGTYSVVVSNIAGFITSSNAVLTLTLPPTITQEPVSASTTPGASVMFTIGATGGLPLSYQWQFNGGNLSGATNATLTLSNVQTNQAGSYAMVVTNAAGSTISSDAVLTVNVPPVITQQPASVTAKPGTAVTFSVAATSTMALSYQWSLNGTIIPNATNSALTIAGVQAAIAGTYCVVVRNLAGSATSSNAILTLTLAPTLPPTITQQPSSVTATQGASVMFMIGATGAAPLADQWQFNGGDLPGATNATLMLSNVQTNQAGFYSAIVTNAAGSTISSYAVLTVNVPPGISQQPASVVCGQGANVAFNANATGTAPLTYQWQFNGNNLPGATGPVLTLSNVQTIQAGFYSVVVTNVAGSALSSNALLVVNVAPGITQQPTSVITNQGATVAFGVTVVGAAGVSYQWSFNGTGIPSATNSTLTLAGVQSSNVGSYCVVVSNFAGSATSSDAVLTLNLPPTITQEPTSVITNQGADVAFGVIVTGTSPVTYQWQFNATNLTGATNGALTLSNVQASQAGFYAVIVTNVAGSTISSYAVLTVNLPPAINPQPVSTTTNQGASVTFAVGATGVSPLSYQWQFNGSNLAGATNATLTLSNVQTNQAGFYAVVVTNALGSTISSNAVLVVNVPPANPPIISLISPADQAAFCYGNNSSVTIPLLASVGNSVRPPTNVAFFAGETTLLGSATSAPYSVSWTNAIPGNYSLTATASFADGSTLTSSPAPISISAQCGNVAIVRNFADPEIGLLQTNLIAMGLTSQVFDQAGLTFAVLTNYQLVIWDGLGGQTNRITDNTVSVLQSVFTNGIPLYLIGDNLASDTLQLDQPLFSEWIQLTSLNSATASGGDGTVEVSSPLVMDPILNGRFGSVSSFVYPANVDLTTLANTNATVLGQSGSNAPVLVVLPGWNVVDTGQPRIVTQNFRVANGTDANSLAQRQTLFLNAVCWLVRCLECSQVYPSLTSSVSPEPATVGQPVTYQWVVDNNGECDGIGAILSSVLPFGAQFVGAASETGTWAYDTNLATVIFRIGLLPHRSEQTVNFTIIPLQPGLITNTTAVIIYGLLTNEVQAVTQVNGLSLLRPGGTNGLLRLSGEPGQSYQIQTSTDLLQWLDWTNVQGPTWAGPLPVNFTARFFRAVR